METPICDFARQYAQEKPLRLHMPGHKGFGPLGVEQWDLTEVEGADVLYHTDGIIQRSQEQASALFGSGKTLYSTEGSSLSIRAMLHLVTMYAAQMHKKPLIAAGRNAHKTFMTGAALLDVEVTWLYPQNRESLLSCEITPKDLEQTLLGMEELPVAVYLTSPDYLGNRLDLQGISQVCRRYGVLLLVDNAHGAYLRFLPESLHPLDLGADLCCDSAHKTLPVLTGGGYLHISKSAPKFFFEQAEQAMALFASTSPSYLILQSLDAVNRYLAEGYRGKLAKAVERIGAFKEALPFPQVGQEPLKLTLAPKAYGYWGTELASLLQQQGIVCEFSDPDFVTMMLSAEMVEADWERLQKALCAVKRKEPISHTAPLLPHGEKCCSLREALLAPSQNLPVESCLGRILGAASVTCPPAIPILLCGERIDEAAIACFEYYGITHCRVL